MEIVPKSALCEVGHDKPLAPHDMTSWNKPFLFAGAVLFFLFSPASFVLAQEPEEIQVSSFVEDLQQPDRYFKGTVKVILPPVETEEAWFPFESVVHALIHLDGTPNEERIEAEYSDRPEMTEDDLRTGERVVIVETYAFAGEKKYLVIDRYRIPPLILLGLLFLGLATLFAKRRGFTAVIGLGFSLAILLGYTVPAITGGSSPFFVASLSACLIAVVSLTVAHGFSRQTGLALTSTLLTLFLSLGLSELFVRATHLFGMGSEEALLLSFGGLEQINLRGLLLAGIVIGTLGVLDDVTTTQTATIKALAEEKREKNFPTLFRSGLRIGEEHIVSLVNTLALAYAGASLPLLLAFSVNEGTVPWWTIVNGEMVAEELVRTLVGSTALVLAVPISTVIAAWYYSSQKQKASTTSVSGSHVH